MFTGIGLLSTMAATITAFLVGQEERSGLQDVQERLARIEALLERQAHPEPGGLEAPGLSQRG